MTQRWWQWHSRQQQLLCLYLCPPWYHTAWAGCVTSARIPFSPRKSWEQGLVGSSLQATGCEALPEQLEPGLSPCHCSWQGAKEEPPHPFFFGMRCTEFTQPSLQGLGQSADGTFPPLAHSLSIYFGLLSPGFWQKDSLRERETCPGKAVSPQGGSLSCALVYGTSPFTSPSAPGFSVSPRRQKPRAHGPNEGCTTLAFIGF